MGEVILHGFLEIVFDHYIIVEMCKHSKEELEVITFVVLQLAVFVLLKQINVLTHNVREHQDTREQHKPTESLFN